MKEADNNLELIRPSWSAAKGVHAFSTTRLGGVSKAPYDSMNLGLHVADQKEAVLENRRTLQQLAMPGTPRWLNQVHGVEVCSDTTWDNTTTRSLAADASCTRKTGEVLAILTADCLPVVIATAQLPAPSPTPGVAVAHAGWRGLVAGVLEATVSEMAVEPDSLCAWLGPAIGPQNFEVGDEVRDEFLSKMPDCDAAFVAGVPGKWFADLYKLARQALEQAGIRHITGGDYCTHSDAHRFFSHRRDGAATGRMGTFAWIESQH